MQLKLTNIDVRFAGLTEPALHIDELMINSGEQVAVTGASGSGKSTLINIITGLERTSTGQILWNKNDLATMRQAALDRWRGENIGLIMQDFHLFAGLSSLENVLLPLKLRWNTSKAALLAAQQRAMELLERTGLRRHNQPVEKMSRGEMQRVAIARALLRKPAVIIADEPTASLDTTSGGEVADLILQMAKQENCTTIIVSHDERLVSRLPRRVALANGRIAENTIPQEKAA